MKYDTIIFDLDGTLLNTLDDLCDSLNEILLQEGYMTRTLDEVRRFIGNGVRRLVELSLPDESSDDEISRITSLFQQQYKNNFENKTRPYDGIMELLSDLKKLNYKSAIVSNKFDSATKALAQHFFDGLIAVAIGETAQIRRKPAPDSVLEAVAELGSDIAKAVLVGDSETDIETAKNAGIPCIGVSWGFRGRRLLEKHGADYIIDSPGELIDLIRSIS
ncbi:MAG: HAD family hydrolase [Clostridiales bacterium]|nr:HAD family hydrolase [Clostridiales bacterium]